MSGPAAADELIDVVLDGRYRVIEPIGHGAMGVVYRGERLHLGRTVAIKVLHESLPNELAARARFEHEARAMARLDHPHCVAVLDVGMHETRPYVVMEMVTGESLRAVLDRGPLDVARAIAIARQILSGLGHAHELGIVHRDIKPANLMLGQMTGLGDHVKILDFGLARSLGGTSTRLTTGLVLGTPAYMSPEQCRDAGVDARSDIYACGVVLFEMLTGRKPFVSAKDDPIEVVGMHMHKLAPRLAEAAPNNDFGALELVVARALAKRPEDRYASAVELADALDVAARGDTSPVERLDPSDVAVETAAPPSPPVPLPSPPSAAPLDEPSHRGAEITEPVIRRRGRPSYLVLATAGGGVLVVAALILLASTSSSSSSSSTSTTSAALTPSADARVPIRTADVEPPTAVAIAPAPDAIVSVIADAAPPPIDAAEPAEPAADDLAGQALYDAAKHVSANDIEGALRILKAAHAAYSANPDIPYMAGRLYLQRQRYHDAIASFRAATDLFPGYRDDPELAKLVVQAFLATPSRNTEIAQFLHELGATAKPLLRDAAATNSRAATELLHL